MKNHKPIWNEKTILSKREPLKEDISVPVAIVGGGMAGLLTALFLQEQGIKSVVLEANSIGSGQSGKTTAKITLQHGLCYDKLIHNIGASEARDYASANRKAIDSYRRLIRDRNISCDFQECSSFLYTKNQVESLEKEKEAMASLGIASAITKDIELPFEVSGALKIENQGMFQPLQFIKQIAQDLVIYEDTKVIGIEGSIIKTTHATIKADKIILTCHFPFINSPGYYFMRMHQERSYILALKKAGTIKDIYYGIDEGGLSFRPWKEFLLLGGAGHRTGENENGGQYDFLKKEAEKLFPNCEIAAAWSAQDCMSVDGIPYIGQFSSSTPHMYVATGFNKWGMTHSMVAAMILSDMIIKRENPFSKVFTPHRFYLKASACSLKEEGVHAVKGLSKGMLSIPKEMIEHILPGKGGVVEYEGKAVGVYKEDNGECHIVNARCSHLGCRLAWNPEELSWDCPCHGSRFTIDGELIDNPSGKNLSC